LLGAVGFPAGQVECFQGLVGEVEHVPDLKVAVVGGGRKEHGGDAAARVRRHHRLAGTNAAAHSRGDGAFGAL
jgi:hypothetical protein